MHELTHSPPFLASALAYFVLDTPFEKLAYKDGRGRWVTYGINNGYRDPIRMAKADYIGEVIVVKRKP